MKQALYVVLIVSCIPIIAASAYGDESVEELRSPKLTLLMQKVKSEDDQAVESFWREISEQTAPMVEAIPGDTEHVLLTFLWRGNDQTRNVVLFSVLTTRPTINFSAEQLTESLLSRLPGTDIWYRTFIIRHDARLSYRLSVSVGSDQYK